MQIKGIKTLSALAILAATGLVTLPAYAEDLIKCPSFEQLEKKCNEKGKCRYEYAPLGLAENYYRTKFPPILNGQFDFVMFKPLSKDNFVGSLESCAYRGPFENGYYIGIDLYSRWYRAEQEVPKDAKIDLKNTNWTWMDPYKNYQYKGNSNGYTIKSLK